MANCEDFTVTFQNSTDAEIKVTKFEYKNGSKWENEKMFGLDGHQKIEKDHAVGFKRDLEGVGDEVTQFRVTYNHHVGGTLWGSDKCAVTGTFTAHDNGKKTVILTA